MTAIATQALPASPGTPEGRIGHLVVLSGTNVGQVFKLEEKRTPIGREDDVEIQILDAGISRHHAIVTRDVNAHAIAVARSDTDVHTDGDAHTHA